MKSNLALIAATILILSGCQQFQNEITPRLSSHQGPVKITGAYALYPLITLWVEEYQKENPGVEFEILPEGSGVGLRGLVNGSADLAMVSGDVPPAYDSLLCIMPVARVGVVMITSTSNPFLPIIRQKGVTRSKLAMAFTTDQAQTWSEWFGGTGNEQIHVYVRSDSSGANDQLAKFLWQTPTEIMGTGVQGEFAMIEAVMKDPFSLGYCNFIYAIDPPTQQFKDGIAVIPFDREQKGLRVDSFYDSVPLLQRAMWSGKYPNSMIRDICLVSLDKPSTVEMVDFLKWILTKGQRMVARQGYIELPSSVIRCRLDLLKNLEK